MNNSKEFKINNIYSGFKLINEKEIKEMESTGRLFEHVKTGAQLYYISNEDDNKVFSISFRTPPADSTGLPHILEHSVLCGSRKYPIKEPFVELIKGSLNTFLNAMTFPDKTMYPVASKNSKDFMNLMDVYLDAVFYPRIYSSKEIFLQEGWHYHLEAPDEEITYNGVVYNEMKGAFSNPEDVLGRKIQESLFPDTAYGMESGGDPDDIPNLTYDDFLEFHKKYYHPSNSYIYLYGDGDVLAHLNYLNENYLNDFDRIEIDSSIKIQKGFEQQKEEYFNYPVGENEDLKDKTFLTMNYVLDRCTNAETHLALDILAHILTDAQSSPINKALLDAKVGKDVSGYYDGSILQPVFSVIVKNSEEDKIEDFKKILKDTLTELATKGIEKDVVQGAVNLTEFKLKEEDHGSYPRGLIHGIQIMESWLHGYDPSIHLEYQKVLDTIKAEMDNRYFEKFIEKYLLNNNHSSLIVLKPEKGLAQKKDEETRNALMAYKEKLSKEEIEELVHATEELFRIQDTPDREEDLKTIPVLPVSDIKKEHEIIPVEIRHYEKSEVLFHNLHTNGISYIDMYFDAGHIATEEIPYLSMLSRYLGEVSTEKYDYVQVNNAIEMHTGGVDFDLDVYADINDESIFRPKFLVKSRVLEEKTGELFELINQMVFHSRFDEKQRLKEIIQSTKAKMEMDFMSVGHKVVSNRVMSYFSSTAKYVEYIAGVDFYRFITELDKNFEMEWENLFEKMKELTRSIFDVNGSLISITSKESGYQKFEENIKEFYGNLTDEVKAKANLSFPMEALNEGFMTPGKVLYVGKAYNVKKLGYQYTGQLQVVRTIMGTDYLWNKVRVQGGAYGSFFSIGRTGTLFLGSYRDPHLTNTLKIFDEGHIYLDNFNGSQEDMDKYIIGTISNLDTPMTPSMKGTYSTSNYLRNISDDMLQKERDEILACTTEDVRNAAKLLKAAMDMDYLCVLGDEGKINSEKGVFKTVVNIFE
ncbi:MAG: insulinase family protein [Eubacteriaceae bacterium]|nr:insulinase family protein [Eubacteriaceae bacterium]